MNAPVRPLHLMLPPAQPITHAPETVLGSGPGGPLPAPSPWVNSGTYLSYAYGVVIGKPTGGNQGNGSLNVTSLYINGAQFGPGTITLDAGTY